MEVIIFNRKLERFFESLPKQTRGKIYKLLEMLEIYGHLIGMPYSKKLASNLFELRSRGNPEVRALFTYHKNKAVIIHAFIKKTKKTPQREMETALSVIKSLT